MKKSHLISLDQGTSSSRSILFTASGDVVGVRQKPLKLYYPDDGWVEQDAEDILNDMLWAVTSLATDYPLEMADVSAVGITNQRETTILWDRHTGKPVYHAIVWQDRRTAPVCADLRARGYEELVSRKTGLLLDPYFSATKIGWILEHVEGVRAAAERGDILFGTVDCFLLWHLTRGAVHATDVTNASRTMLYDISRQCWDDELLGLFGVPASVLPEVRDNVSDFGQMEIGSHDYMIGGMAGDQQAALIGQGCFLPGMVKSTYGTGCFALMNTGQALVHSQNRLLSTIGYRVGGEIVYALEGSIFNAGTAVQFLRDNFGFFENAAESEVLARSVPDSDGVYFVPAFTGLGAPYWDPDARGVISGLARRSTKAHVVRAALEAQGFQTRDLLDAMRADSGGQRLDVIRADGGLVANAFVCQVLADVTRCRVEVPRVAEGTAWGAACLAGVQAGVFSSLAESAKAWHAAQIYEPRLDEAHAEDLYDGWVEAVAKTRFVRA
ncbi:MAG: glycerol kinase GlpK [Alphaproteobacteria bacterium]|nr:glycerol kinase GlpK [Alphaproteobacteria bacterium]